jgi:hypothetical protein
MLIYNISTYDLLLHDFSKYRTGFTGTPIIHIPKELDEKNQFQIIRESGSDEEIKKSILSYDNIEIDNIFIQDILNIIKKSHEPDGKKYSVLIDSGAFIREDIFKIVKIIGNEIFDFFDCVIYIDDDNFKRVLRKNDTVELFTENLNIDPTKRFYFFDNKHITGQDFLIKRDAYGLITFRYNSRLRDISQGLYRLRKIGISQKCDFIYLKNDILLIENILNLLKKPKSTNITNNNIYDVLKYNDDDWIIKTKSSFIRQNLLSLLRLNYESTFNNYGIQMNCNNYDKIFQDNIYTLPNFVKLSPESFKTNINEILLNILKISIKTKNGLFSEGWSFNTINDTINDTFFGRGSSQNDVDTIPNIEIAVNVNINVNVNVNVNININVDILKKIHISTPPSFEYDKPNDLIKIEYYELEPQYTHTSNVFNINFKIYTNGHIIGIQNDFTEESIGYIIFKNDTTTYYVSSISLLGYNYFLQKNIQNIIIISHSNKILYKTSSYNTDHYRDHNILSYYTQINKNYTDIYLNLVYDFIRYNISCKNDKSGYELIKLKESGTIFDKYKLTFFLKNILFYSVIEIEEHIKRLYNDNILDEIDINIYENITHKKCKYRKILNYSNDLFNLWISLSDDIIHIHKKYIEDQFNRSNINNLLLKIQEYYYDKGNQIDNNIKYNYICYDKLNSIKDKDLEKMIYIINNKFKAKHTYLRYIFYSR